MGSRWSPKLSVEVFLHFFPPSCVPWVRNCKRPVVGSRGYGSERQMRSREPTTATGQPKLRNPGMGLVELAPPTKKAKRSAGGAVYPRIVRNARKSEEPKPIRRERQQTKQSRFTQAKGKSRQLKLDAADGHQSKGRETGGAQDGRRKNAGNFSHGWNTE